MPTEVIPTWVVEFAATATLTWLTCGTRCMTRVLRGGAVGGQARGHEVDGEGVGGASPGVA